MTPVFDLLVRALALLAAAWVATALLRRRSASVRALIWTTALAGVLLVPVLLVFGPEWRVPVWREVAAAETPRDAWAVTPPPTADTNAVHAVTSQISAAFATEPVGVVPESAPAPWRPSTRAILLAGSAIVTLALLLRLWHSHRRLTRLRVARYDDPAWTALVNGVAADLGLRKRVAVRVSDEVNVPAVAGLMRPVLLLPPDATSWPAELRRAVAIHELAHVARWDAVAQLVGQLACALYWFVPFVWHAARRAAALRERASDDAVLRAGIRPAAYANGLVTLAAAATGAELQPAVLAMARRSHLAERVDAILDPAMRRQAMTRPRTLTFVAAAVAATILASGIVLTAAPAVLYLPDDVTAEPTPAPLGNAPSITVATPTFAPLTRPAPPTIDEQQAPPSPPPARRLCDGELNNSSRSVNENDGHRRLTMKMSGRGCKIDLTADGKFEFNADFTDISTIGSGGFFRLDVTENGVRRELNIEPRNGTLVRTWRVDGRELPYDAAAQAWFATFLIELDRQTAIGVATRLPALLKRGGVDAVLAETSLMPSDYARGEYYTRLAKTTTLAPAELTRLLKQAAQLTKSDHYAATLVAAVAGRKLDDANRLAMAEIIDRMESDHYRSESIGALAGAGRLTSAELSILVKLTTRMESDHYKTEVLRRLLSAGDLDAAQLAELAGAASTIDSDHYAAEFLKALATRGMTPPVQHAFLKTATTIRSGHYLAEVLTTLIGARGTTALEIDELLKLVPAVDSDHYRSNVLTKLLELPQLSERNLLAAVDAARVVRSDHYKAEVLQRAGRHAAATDRVRQAVVDATAGMSSHYANAVRRVVGK